MQVEKRTLREWRAKRNMNKLAVSKKLGIHPTTYTKWENNPEDMKISDAVRVSEVLECKVGDILFFESNPNLNLEIVTGVM